MMPFNALAPTTIADTFQNKEMPLVSVIIPSFGRPVQLSRAVKSVLNQTYNNIEIIVINDNDKETEFYIDTCKILDAYSDNEHVKVVSSGVNSGGSQARNLGIKAAGGEYITFLDDDDFYYENKILEQLIHIKKTNCDVSVCNMDIETSNSDKGKAIVGTLSDFLLNGNTYTPMFFMKKDVLNKVGGFTDTPRFQDHILMLKILKAGFKVQTLNRTLFFHTDHFGSGITSEKNFKIGYMKRLAVEETIIPLVSSKVKRKHYIISCLALSRLARNDDDILTSFSLLAKALISCRDLEDLIKTLKRGAGVILKKTSRK